ncbi:MAG: hypothetical protein LJE83_10605 [Gammaproteobacteria bacterium]|nr:hypothetical protein [Gammaproteobacteria bacterium]
MNILYIGSSGALSLVPFRKLLSSEHTIVAAGVYKPLSIESRIIALENASLALAAQQQRIPVIDLSRDIRDVIELCSKYSIDVIVMSCYSKRLSEDMVNLAGKGCFNMHPSLLPEYRGPEPVFWQMKNASDLGVCWHRVVHELDAGDIVAQKNIFPHDGASYEEISMQLAKAGAELLLQLLADLMSNRLSAVKQQAELATYYPYPEKQDFVIDTSWTAQHAYNFMRATNVFGQLYHCRPGRFMYMLDAAVDYDNNSYLETAEVRGNRLYIPCKDGVLIATYTGKITL